MAAFSVQSQGLEKIMDFPSSTTIGHGRMLVVHNNKLFFHVDDGIHGNEIWTSDGTTGGTALLKDINPIGNGGGGTKANVMGNDLYFSAQDGVSSGFWKTDGTTGNTQFVASPGYYDQVQVVNNKLFFMGGTSSTTGAEPFISDGTTVGTMLIKDIHPGNSMWLGRKSIAFNNEYYFTGGDGIGPGPIPNQLWKSDGTAAGTIKLEHLIPQAFAELNGELFIIAADSGGIYGQELFKTDGTYHGITLVKDVVLGPQSGVVGSEMMVVGNYLYFQAFNGGNGVELWKTDGSIAGTALVKDINPNNNGSSSQHIDLLAGVGNTLYFSADDGVHGVELWKTDGTAAGTVMVKDVLPGSGGSNPHDFAVLANGEMFFNTEIPVLDKYLWRTDGTAAGTKQMKDFGNAYLLQTGNLVMDNTLFFFDGNQNDTRELWKYTPCVSTFDSNIVTIAVGDSIWLGGAYQTISGIYMDTFTATNSCDSILSTLLCVPSYYSDSVLINAGDSVWAGGAYQTMAGTYQDTLTTIYGCDSIITTVIDVITNNRIVAPILTVNIYPNPVKQHLWIDIGIQDNLQLELVNSLGQVIEQKALREQLTALDLEAYQRGIYFLRISNEEERIMQKIIRQ